MTTDPAPPAMPRRPPDPRNGGVSSITDRIGELLAARDERFWHRFALRALLVLGAAHFLAGVVFFFAYNWDDLSALSKFATLQVGVIAAFVAALSLRVDSPAGQSALIAASVFTGVLLAVIGQVYQTGADAWELFAAWTLLILPFVLASRSAVHWSVWMVVAMTAVALYGAQRLVALGRIEHALVFVATGLVPAALLTLREWQLHLGARWLDAAWIRPLLAALALGAMFFPAVEFLVETRNGSVGMIAFIAVAGAGLLAYGRRLPDFPAVAVITALCTLMGMAIGARLIHEVVGFHKSAGALVFGLALLGAWCAFLTTGAVKWLRRFADQLGDADE